jgi:hypothetical protein
MSTELATNWSPAEKIPPAKSHALAFFPVNDTERAERREAHKCHIAFNVSLPELLATGRRLNAAGIQTQNFAGEKTTEPSVIGWMPSAQLYFHDRDGHSLEFITLLDESPEPEFVGSLIE